MVRRSAEQIKSIPVSKLKPGMYVHDLNCDWLSHPFIRNRFPVRSEAEIQQIVEAGVKELYIDTSKGDDVRDAVPLAQLRSDLDADMRAIAATQPAIDLRTDIAEELGVARKIHHEAHTLVRNMMQDARLGNQVELDRVEPLVEDITASIFRNSGALTALCLIKGKDDYTFLHSVGVCTLMISFARSLELPPEVIQQAGIGGLLHDIGKTFTPDDILNKPDRLAPDEFSVMRKHPEDGLTILQRTPEIGDIPRSICIEHHERMDGSGYPFKLAGEQISQMGKMSAIVDVYDALTSDRSYHAGMAPTDALRKMLEWSRHHFDPQYVQAFMRCIGIYPVGSLVRLASGKLAVVAAQNSSSLLTPKVRAFYDIGKTSYITPCNIDLALGHDKIVTHESPAKWSLTPMDYLVEPA
ncbi:MAG: HD-GYP domain-containing protein [Burkholderiaceae bacterium]|nr:MAG: HD-GYP domain-containing protein [Burkholderiaceae bacterium]